MTDTQATEASKPEQPATPSLGYLGGVLKHFSASEIKSGLRALRSGVFVDEALCIQLFENYRLWRVEVQSSKTTPSDEKCRRRMFGTESPELYYLLDGKLCIPGYLIPSEQPLDRNSFSIPYSQASLLDAKQYIHPRDRILNDAEGVSLGHGSGKGFYLSLRCGEKQFTVMESGLKSFGLHGRESSKLVQKFPALKGALRDSLQPLREIIRTAKPITSKQKLLIPSSFRAKKGTSLLRCESLVLVMEENTRLIDCFDSRGKSLRALIDEEFQNSKNKRIGAFELTPKDKRFLAKIKIRGKYFRLHRKAFLEVVRNAHASPTFRKELKPRYTVRDCLQVLGEVMRLADWVSVEEGDGKKGKAKVKKRLQYGRWVFKTGEKYSIVACEERR